MLLRLISALVLLALLLGSPAAVRADAGYAGLYDAMPQAQAAALLNAVRLHPQRTGYPLLDELLEQIVAPSQGQDNYTRLRQAYDWCVYEIDYSWAPYSQDWAPAYDCFDLRYRLDYEEGLQPSLPYEVANRAYHALSAREGICYDFGAAFAVIARYLGFEAFVHTGYFRFEDRFGGALGHHGWATLSIGAVEYIFDPQRDYRLSDDATAENPFAYFCIAPQNDWRYSPDFEDNAARDAQYLPVSAGRVYQPVVRAVATHSGSAFGSRAVKIGEPVTLRAYGDGFFLGWFERSGAFLSADRVYTFTAQASITCFAVFDAAFFAQLEDALQPDTQIPGALTSLARIAAQTHLRQFFARP